MELYPATSLNINSNLPGPKLARVKGSGSARQYPTSPNGEYAIFDEDSDHFYFIKTDANNFKHVFKRCAFVEDPEPEPTQVMQSTQNEILSLKEEMRDVKQSIRDLTAAISNGYSRKKQHYDAPRKSYGSADSNVVSPTQTVIQSAGSDVSTLSDQPAISTGSSIS